MADLGPTPPAVIDPSRDVRIAPKQTFVLAIDARASLEMMGISTPKLNETPLMVLVLWPDRFSHVESFALRVSCRKLQLTHLVIQRLFRHSQFRAGLGDIPMVPPQHIFD
jgi:hypothetical protein